MNLEQQKISARLTSHKRWQWLPGMQFAECSLSRARCRVLRAGNTHLTYFWSGSIYNTQHGTFLELDLDDAATAGVLFALVFEAPNE